MSSVTTWFLNTSRLLKNPEQMTSFTRVSSRNMLWRSMDTTPMRLRSSKRFHLSLPKILSTEGFSSS